MDSLISITVRRIRVLLADDHTVVLEGLRRVLEPECEIVGTVTDGRALVAVAEKVKPDVVVADISMPLLNGIDAMRQIRKTARNVKVVFLTMHADVSYAAQALAAGGSGFVLKTSAAEELLFAISEAMKGRRFVTPALSSQVSQALAKRGSQGGENGGTLTARQREVLQLVAEGKTLKDIAGILHVSPRTVEFHKYRMTEELGLRSTGELTQYAIKHGLVGA
jgi:DNA-binding NarL/FixJ family response regulator